MALREGLRCILVVDDEWLIADALDSMLRDLGHQVLGPAPSVSRALKLIAAGPPDAALLDISLGGEKSFPIARELEARGIPFAFLTGYSRPDLPTEFSERPLLSKPVPLAALRHQMSAMLTRDQA